MVPHKNIPVCTAEAGILRAIRRAVDLRVESGLPGFPGFPLSPEHALILLWAGLPGFPELPELSILARQEDRALVRLGGQNGTWDHPGPYTPRVHHATVSRAW